MAGNTDPREVPHWGLRMGEHLETARIRSQMSRAELARRVGVSEESIRRWERGGAQPSPERLAQVIAVMSIDAGRMAKLAPTSDERPPFARRLLEERTARGITQAQAAQFFDVAQPTYAGWEIGRAIPGSAHVADIAAFLGASEAETSSIVAAPFHVDYDTWPALGRVMGARREFLRMTRADLAQSMGVAPGTIAAWELGHRTPRPARIRSLAAALKASVEELELALPRDNRPSSALGQLIRSRQHRLGLNLEEVAASAGLDEATLSRWIHGRSRPQPDKLEQLAETLDVPLPLLRSRARLPSRCSPSP